MSVLAEVDGKTYSFVKGAPEVISKLCSSSVPSDFLQQNDLNARKGYRVLALAWKEVN